VPLVFTENEATESGISYLDHTGISYQYPGRYRKIIQTGERFIYYKGRKKRQGGRAPQVYFGAGIVGATLRDTSQANRFTCAILDYKPFPNSVSFKDGKGEYFERGASRRGYFQPGVRIIAERDFERILDAAETEARADDPNGVTMSEAEASHAQGYASPTTLKAVEEFALRVATNEVLKRWPDATVKIQSRNNPGFDVMIKLQSEPAEVIYLEVKGTTRALPQFFITEGELRFSRRHAGQFSLIVVYAIRLDSAAYKIFWHDGSVSVDEGFHLNPVQWACEAVSDERDALRRASVRSDFETDAPRANKTADDPEESR
jgi:hypothetical protein